MNISVKNFCESSKQTKDLAYRLKNALEGVKIEQLDFKDHVMLLKGKWEEIFPLMPYEMVLGHINKYEMIFTQRKGPRSCFTFEVYGDERSIRGVFSVKENGRWFQYLRYFSKDIGQSIELQIRDRQDGKEKLVNRLDYIFNELKLRQKIEEFIECNLSEFFSD